MRTIIITIKATQPPLLVMVVVIYTAKIVNKHITPITTMKTFRGYNRQMVSCGRNALIAIIMP